LLPERTVTSPDGVELLWTETTGKRTRLAGGAAWDPKRSPPPSGPIVLPARTWLGVTLAPASREEIAARLASVLELAGGERLDLGLPRDLAPSELAVALAPTQRALAQLRLFVPQDTALGLGALHVGAFAMSGINRPDPLPRVTWGLLLNASAGVSFERILDESPGLRVLGAELEDVERVLARFGDLERLQLRAESFEERHGVLLAALPRLRALDVFFTHLERGALAALSEGEARLEDLSLLHASASPGEPKILREIGRLGTLRKLSVTGLDSTSVVGWERLERLESLTIDGHWPALNAVAWRALAGLPRLRVLATNGGGLGDFTIGLIAKCPMLEQLSLRHEFELSDEGLKALHGHPKLTDVWISDTKTTPEGRKLLEAALRPGARVVP